MRIFVIVFVSSWKPVSFAKDILLAYIGAAAAYTQGEEWLEQMLGYVEGNIDFTENYLKEHVRASV